MTTETNETKEIIESVKNYVLTDEEYYDILAALNVLMITQIDNRKTMSKTLGIISNMSRQHNNQKTQ